MHKIIMMSPFISNKYRLSDILNKIQSLKETYTEILTKAGRNDKLASMTDIDNKLYLRADGDSIGAKVGIAFMSDDIKAVEDISNRITEGQNIISEWALNHLGIVVLSGGDDIAVILPANTPVQDIEDLREIYSKKVGATLSVGLGDSPSQCANALLYAKLTGKDKTVTYTNDIQQKIADLTMASNDPEAKKLQDEGYIKKNDQVQQDLNKALMNKLGHIMLAGALASSGVAKEPHHIDKQSREVASLDTSHHEHITNKKTEMHPDLKHISQIESSGGLNKKHVTVTKGLNKGHTAGGALGLMPLTILDIIRQHHGLQDKYHDLSKKTPNQITAFINTNPDAENEIANHHWSKLNKLFGNDHAKKAYAWLNGIAGTQKATPEQIAKNPYVKKYLNLKNEHQNVAKAEIQWATDTAPLAKKLPEKKVKKIDMIPGGLADKKKPSDFDRKSLLEGAKVEMEHTSDMKIAIEIAMDHLTEDKEYYKKLKTIEKK